MRNEEYTAVSTNLKKYIPIMKYVQNKGILRKDETLMNFIETYECCCKKTKIHFEKFKEKLFEPTEVYDGDYYATTPIFDFPDNRWVWLTSMITGLAPILYDTTKDEEALEWANQFKREYHDKVFRTYTQTMHDLGFLYIPYSLHLYQLTGDTEHRDTALRAADELAKRFKVNGNYIDAWGEMNGTDPKSDGYIIIDSSMNVPLLYWAWKETGHKFYYDIANAHLETVIKLLVREDYSVAHAWRFNSDTEMPEHESNTCGYANGSHWARGTGWLIFGLAMAYSYTKKESFLDVAVKVAEKYLYELSGEIIPVWDFRLPEDKPAKMCSSDPTKMKFVWDEKDPANKVYNIDTSAAAIIVCGLQLINKFKPNKKFEKYVDDCLSALSEDYFEHDMTKPAMLSHSNGRNSYTTYGDYYFMLALAMKLYGITSPWGYEEKN